LGSQYPKFGTSNRSPKFPILSNLCVAPISSVLPNVLNPYF
jgi:hypothetical protein